MLSGFHPSSSSFFPGCSSFFPLRLCQGNLLPQSLWISFTAHQPPHSKVKDPKGPLICLFRMRVQDFHGPRIMLEVLLLNCCVVFWFSVDFHSFHRYLCLFFGGRFITFREHLRTHRLAIIHEIEPLIFAFCAAKVRSAQQNISNIPVSSVAAPTSSTYSSSSSSSP